jgi:hypothetical protein
MAPAKKLMQRSRFKPEVSFDFFDKSGADFFGAMVRKDGRFAMQRDLEVTSLSGRYSRSLLQEPTPELAVLHRYPF